MLTHLFIKVVSVLVTIHLAIVEENMKQCSLSYANMKKIGFRYRDRCCHAIGTDNPTHLSG